MRKLMMLMAILALALVAAAPAIAQVTEGFSEKSTKSGGASPAVKASNSGKNFNFCPTDLQHVNTGNTLNEQGEVQNKSTSDGPGFGGTDLSMVPTETGTCDQTMRQAAGAK